MANITVTSSGYWGDDTILVSGSWAALAWNDVVTIQSGAVCTVDPAVRTPTGIDIGVNIECTAGFSQLVINNQSTSAVLKYYGPYLGIFRFENGCKLTISGNYIQVGVGNGLENQQLTDFTSYGYDVMDVPAVLFVETASGTNVYEPWMNTGSTLIAEMGVGVLGKWFEYDDTTGYIKFGNNGLPQELTTDANSGQTDIVVADASDYTANDYLHIIDDNGRETVEISSISGNTITCKTNLARTYTTSGNAFVRLVKGGNVVPSGAKIKAYNLVVGTKNDSGTVVVAPILTDNFELDTSKGGELSISNVYFTGIYLYIAYSGKITIDGIGVILTITTYYLINQKLSHAYVCPDKYSTTVASAITGGPVSNSLIFEDCIFASCNISRTIAPFPLSTFRRVQIWMLSITVSTNRALNSSSVNDCIFEDILIIGGVQLSYSGSAQSITNMGLSSSQTGIPYAFASNYIWTFQNDSASILDNFYIIPDGCSGVPSIAVASITGMLINSNLESITVPSLLGCTPAIIQIIRCTGRLVPGNIPIIFSNGNFDVTIKNVHFDALLYPPWSFYLPSKCIFMGYDTNTKTIPATVGPTLDTHFYEMRGPEDINSGIMGIIFNPRSDTGTGYTESSKDDLRWNNNGSMYIISAGGWILYEWPHWIIGITAFPSDGIVTIAGSGTDNFTLEYQIDIGSGWTALAVLNHTNLSAHTINPLIGFRFRVKISHAGGSTSDYLNRLNWDTVVDYNTYRYPLDIVNITLQNVVDGSRYYIYNQTTSKEVASGVQIGSADIIIPDIPYNGVDEILLIRIRKGGGGLTDYKPFETNATLTSNGATVWISQVPDDLTT